MNHIYFVLLAHLSTTLIKKKITFYLNAIRNDSIWKMVLTINVIIILVKGISSLKYVLVVKYIYCYRWHTS